jgi:hypothetical protein
MNPFFTSRRLHCGKFPGQLVGVAIQGDHPFRGIVSLTSRLLDREDFYDRALARRSLTLCLFRATEP